jgi:hypothetical protein
MERTETRRYSIQVKFFRGDLSDMDYSIFVRSVRKKLETVLPYSFRSGEAKISSISERKMKK